MQRRKEGTASSPARYRGKDPLCRRFMAGTVCLTFDFDALSLWINRRQTSPASLSRGEFGAVAVPPNSPDEFAKFIAENIDKWTKVIKFAGIKPQ